MSQLVNTNIEKNHQTFDKRIVSFRATLDHVAKEAGVAVSTASAILGKRKHCYASEETCRSVEMAAKKLGYIPNRFARGLRGQNTKLIGMICPELSRPAVTLSRVSSIENETLKDGMQVIFGTHRYNPDREREYIKEFLAFQVDGLLVFSGNPENNELLADIVRRGIPIVACEVSSDLSGLIPSVTTDRELGGYLQVKHVIEDAKRKKILFLMGGTGGVGVAKIRGYNKALKEQGSDMREHLVVEKKVVEGDVFQNGIQMIQEAIDKGWEFDAMVTTSDCLAIGAISVLGLTGRRIPEDVAVVGFDNEDFSAVLPVPLTTIQHPKGLAKIAYDLLKDQIQKIKTTSVDCPRILLPPELIIRQSSIKNNLVETETLSNINFVST